MSEELPLIRPNDGRGAQTIARCHDRLAAHRRKLEQDARKPTRAVVAERFVLVGVCAAYLVSMAGDLIKVISPR